jgi:hypothetical protein
MNMVLHLMIVMVVVIAGGCANTNVKMVDDWTFLSTDDPNLKIQVAPDYVRKQEDQRRYRYEFVNEEERRYVLIQYYHKPVHTRNIDYYYNPATWIFYDLPNCEEIEKGELEMLDRKWYYRDYIHHGSTASCSMIRDMGHFTPKKAVVKVLYWQDLPPHKCQSWKGISHLSATQREKRGLFLNNHQEDIKISVYEPE